MRRFAPAAFLVAAALSGCSSEGNADAGINFCAPPLGYPGNEKNVGAGCTQGGNECAANGEGNAQFCAIDLDSEGAPFCILIGCNSHESCGDNACCTGRASSPIKACVPKPCLVEDPDPANVPCPDTPGVPDAGPGGGDAARAD